MGLLLYVLGWCETGLCVQGPVFVIWRVHNTSIDAATCRLSEQAPATQGQFCSGERSIVTSPDQCCTLRLIAQLTAHHTHA